MFDAEEGRVYEIEVLLGSLSDSYVNLYGSDGELLASEDDTRRSYIQGSRVVWEAPAAGVYYVAVSSHLGEWVGDTGSYILTVLLLADSDDHAGSTEGATRAIVGESVDGVLDYDGDVDFFVSEAEGKQRYRIEVVPGTLPDSIVELYLYGPGGDLMEKFYVDVEGAPGLSVRVGVADGCW